jgi:hypothetical protein
MHQEPPDKLVRLERHGLVAAGPLDPVVLVTERYAGRGGGDEAAVGDRDAMGVAGQIGQHLLRPGERPLAIDEPLGPMQRREIGLERGLGGEVGVVAEELQAAGVVDAGELRFFSSLERLHDPAALRRYLDPARQVNRRYRGRQGTLPVEGLSRREPGKR